MTTSASARVGGYPYRVSEDGTVTRRERGQWRALTRAELQELPAHGDVWTWLREQGVKRGEPSEGHDARKRRGRPAVTLSLPQEVVDALDAAVGAGRAPSRSAAVVDAVRAWVA